MAYRIAATAVLLLHLAFIVFVVAGAVLVWRRRWLAAVQLPAALWGIWIEMSGAGCPLTAAENYLRVRGGQASYTEGFLEHYLLGLVYPAGLTRTTQYALAALVLATNAVLYGCLLLRRRNARHTGTVEVPPADEP
jgi:uncharacterized membrane protein